MSFKGNSSAERLIIVSGLSFLTHIYYSDLVGIAPDICERNCILIYAHSHFYT